MLRKYTEEKEKSFNIRDSILGTDLADMHLLSKRNKDGSFVPCIFVNIVYVVLQPAWFVTWRDEKDVTIFNVFWK